MEREGERERVRAGERETAGELQLARETMRI